jgi:hypothetical protein
VLQVLLLRVLQGAAALLLLQGRVAALGAR